MATTSKRAEPGAVLLAGTASAPACVLESEADVCGSIELDFCDVAVEPSAAGEDAVENPHLAKSVGRNGSGTSSLASCTVSSQSAPAMNLEMCDGFCVRATQRTHRQHKFEGAS